MARIASNEQNEIGGPEANARSGKPIKHVRRCGGRGTTDIGHKRKNAEEKINAAQSDQGNRFRAGVALDFARHSVEKEMPLHADVECDLSENAEESDRVVH